MKPGLCGGVAALPLALVGLVLAQVNAYNILSRLALDE
jgi:hypothetical protein